jgi:hypothetical protein
MIDVVRQLSCPAGAPAGESGGPTVACHAERAGLPPTRGRVRDVSRSGLSVHLDRPLEPGTMLTIELPAADGPPATVLACAGQFRPDPAGGWVIGCRFASELGDGDLAGFGIPKAQAPRGDQRRWARFVPTTGRAVVRPFGVGPGSPAAARILNLSAGGVGLAFHTRVEPGTLLDLELIGGPGHHGLSILASVVYLAPRDEGDWLLGCTFIRELPEAELRSLGSRDCD